MTPRKETPVATRQAVINMRETGMRGTEIAMMEEKLRKCAENVLSETILLDGSTSSDFAYKAVKMMAKVAKKTNNFDDVYEAIISKESSSKCCVVHNEKLPGTYGRINMFVLRLFRYPWLRFDTQVRSTPFCRHPYKRKNPQVCINPYHYRSVEVPRPQLPPVLINKNLNFGSLPTENDETDDSDEPGSTEGPNDRYTLVPNVTIQGDELRQFFEDIATRDNLTPPNPTSPISPPIDLASRNSNQSTSELSSPSSTCTNSNYFQNDVEMKDEEHEGEAKKDEVNKRTKTPSEEVPQYRNGVGVLNANGHDSQYELVELHETKNWVSLTYYEESAAISHSFESSSSYLLVDGFTSSSVDNDRFSLGYFNNVNRKKLTEDIRKLIRRGLRLYNLGGEIFLESLTDFPLFVQSASSNLKKGFGPGTVAKLQPQSTLKIFNMTQFAKQLSQAAEKTYQDVYALTRMCTIRISFLKGWGSHYKRPSVMRAPVWIEVHLTAPLKWIDQVLLCMGAPPMICSSRT